MAWQNVGRAGPMDVKADPESGQIRLEAHWEIPLSLPDAAYLAVLLDEAIGIAKGQAVKLNEDDGV
jgi:hypothetical protein